MEKVVGGGERTIQPQIVQSQLPNPGLMVSQILRPHSFRIYLSDILNSVYCILSLGTGSVGITCETKWSPDYFGAIKRPLFLKSIHPVLKYPSFPLHQGVFILAKSAGVFSKNEYMRI